MMADFFGTTRLCLLDDQPIDDERSLGRFIECLNLVESVLGDLDCKDGEVMADIQRAAVKAIVDQMRIVVGILWPGFENDKWFKLDAAKTFKSLTDMAYDFPKFTFRHLAMVIVSEIGERRERLENRPVTFSLQEINDRYQLVTTVCEAYVGKDFLSAVQRGLDMGQSESANSGSRLIFRLG